MLTDTHPGSGDKICYVEAINKNPENSKLYPVVEISNYTSTYTQEDVNEINYSGEPYEDSPSVKSIKSFQHIAKASQGVEMLGVFKADLDNLGFIFSKGLGHYYSISRVVALSRSINFFFTSYLSRLLKEKYPDSYTLFAGGDDLCVIGPWDKMINLAVDLQKRLFSYVGENKNITISAGINFCKPSYPAGKAVAHSEDILEKAKQDGKNRLAMFGYSANWGDELDRYVKMRDDMLAVDEGRDDSKDDRLFKTSILYRFLHYHKEYLEFKKCKPEGALWISHLHYDIERNLREKIDKIADIDKKTKAKSVISKLLQTHKSGGDEPIISKIPLALFPVIYSQRTN